MPQATRDATPSTGVTRMAGNEDLSGRLRELRDALLVRLVERDEPIRLALIAALAGEHLLMIGPPGTAKSLVARRLHLAFAGSSYFERLLTRFTVPEELFGPLSIKGLEQDRYERLTASYLPTASIAFLDEIFKANSAILNALLTLLNEREFDNGATRVKAPLVAVVGASNELPEGEELDALFDRFLLRLHVGSVSKEGFPGLLQLRGDDPPEVPDRLKLTREDLERVRAEAPQVEVPDDVMALLKELREWCLAEEVPVSDRRWRKVVKLLQVSALTNGRRIVSVWDCWLLQHCLWSTPETRQKIYDWYSARVGTSAAMDPVRLTKVVTSWESRLKSAKDSRSQAKDPKGRLLFKAHDGKPTVKTKGNVRVWRDEEALYLAPENAHGSGGYGFRQQISDRTNGGAGYTAPELEELQVLDSRHSNYVSFQSWSRRTAYLAEPNNFLFADGPMPPLMEPTRYPPIHVEDLLRQVRGIQEEVNAYMAKLKAHVVSLEDDVRSHLWMTPDFVGPATASLERTCASVSTLVDRVEKIREGFEALPREIPLDETIEEEAPSGDEAK